MQIVLKVTILQPQYWDCKHLTLCITTDACFRIMDSPIRKVADEINYFLFNSNYNDELLGFCEAKYELS